MNEGAKLVSSAVLGLDIQTCIVNGKVYVIQPLSIKKLLGMGHYLCNLSCGDDLKSVLHDVMMDDAVKALSWAIKGDESLTEELSCGTYEEIVDGIDAAFQTIKTENFIRLSVLTKSIANLIAKPK